jgi:hypothetical protein
VKKRFIHYDAQGTDGADPARLLAVFEVADDDGFTARIAVPALLSDGTAKEDVAIRAAMRQRPPVEPVGEEA